MFNWRFLCNFIPSSTHHWCTKAYWHSFPSSNPLNNNTGSLPEVILCHARWTSGWYLLVFIMWWWITFILHTLHWLDTLLLHIIIPQNITFLVPDSCRATDAMVTALVGKMENTIENEYSDACFCSLPDSLADGWCLLSLCS